MTPSPWDDPTSRVVSALVDARRHGAAVEATPLLEGLPDVAAAYAVQDRVARELGWFEGAPPRHWKSGGAARDAVLTHAPLPRDGVRASPADARGWRFRLRGIEAEIALRLGRDVERSLAQSLEPSRAGALVDAMCVSIEIVDSRWAEGLDAPPLARLADLQSHGALVLGPWVDFAARNWGAQRCRVTIGSRPAVECCGSHAMNDPLFVLPAWLRHATRGDRTLPAGTVVTTGTWVGILPAAAGDRVTVEFPGIGEASVQL